MVYCETNQTITYLMCQFYSGFNKCLGGLRTFTNENSVGYILQSCLLCPFYLIERETCRLEYPSICYIQTLMHVYYHEYENNCGIGNDCHNICSSSNWSHSPSSACWARKLSEVRKSWPWAPPRTWSPPWRTPSAAHVVTGAKVTG